MNNEFDDIAVDKAVIKDDVTPKDMLKLARQILLVSSILYFLSWIADWVIPGHEIFDRSSTSIPPIVTLVIGYYFGKTN